MIYLYKQNVINSNKVRNIPTQLLHVKKTQKPFFKEFN